MPNVAKGIVHQLAVELCRTVCEWICACSHLVLLLPLVCALYSWSCMPHHVTPVCMIGSRDMMSRLVSTHAQFCTEDFGGN